MKTLHLLITTILFACAAFADEARPTLTLSEAAKLAEDAITSASLPADCYLRSITLIQTPDATAYYRATYKPKVTRRLRVQVGAPPSPHTLDVICIAMDGKVSFEQEELTTARPTIQVQPK